MLLRNLVEIFVFSRCPICGAKREKFFICSRCSSLLNQVDKGYCPLCGEIYKGSQDVFVCGECLTRPKKWDWFGFYGIYEGLLKNLIMDFKYKGDFSVLGVLQRLLFLAYMKHKPKFFPIDFIIPVPVHSNRLKKRGFNQSLEISKFLAKKLGKCIEKNMLIRKRHTMPQVGLKEDERKRNVKNAFMVKTDLKGKDILLIDDVYTTGATVSECAYELKRAGVNKIGVLVIARSIKSISF